MTSFKQCANKLWLPKWAKWIWIGLAVPATRLYYVQEMIAALIIFSVLFIAVAIALLIIFLLDRASQQLMVWAEKGIALLTHWAVQAIEHIARPMYSWLCHIASERK